MTTASEQHKTTVREYSIDFTRLLYMHYLEIDNSIRHADVKAQFILGVNALLFTGIAVFRFDEIVRAFALPMDTYAMIAYSVRFFIPIFLFLSVAFALMTIFPRFSSPRDGSLFFFGNIIDMNQQEFQQKFMDMSLQDVKLTVLAQIHSKSYIVQAKFEKIRWSIIFLCGAILLWGVSYILPI